MPVWTWVSVHQLKTSRPSAWTSKYRLVHVHPWILFFPFKLVSAAESSQPLEIACTVIWKMRQPLDLLIVFLWLLARFSQLTSLVGKALLIFPVTFYSYFRLGNLMYLISWSWYLKKLNKIMDCFIDTNDHLILQVSRDPWINTGVKNWM